MDTIYSKRSLVEKLGLKAGFHCQLFNIPDHYLESLHDLPEDVSFHVKDDEKVDFVHFFTREKAELEKQFSHLKSLLTPAGVLWISWPKGTANIKTDLNENIIRTIGLTHGLVDVKVIAIDENWSGLKFMYRLKDRY